LSNYFLFEEYSCYITSVGKRGRRRLKLKKKEKRRKGKCLDIVKRRNTVIEY